MELSEKQQELLDRIENGCKGGDMGRVALALGHIILDEDGDAVPWEAPHGRLGIGGIIEMLAAYYPQATTAENGEIVSCSRGPAVISVGTGGQILFALKPQTSVGKLKDEYGFFMHRLKQIPVKAEYSVCYSGYHPNALCEDLGPIPDAPQKVMNCELPAKRAWRAWPSVSSLPMRRMLCARCALQRC